MVRQEMIERLIGDDLENINDFIGFEKKLKYLLEHGHSGYKSYSNEELEEEFEDRIGKIK